MGVSAALLVPALAPAVLFAALMPETGNAYAYFLRSLVPCACFAAFTGGMVAALREGGVMDALLGVALAGLLLAMRLLSPDLPTLLLAQNPLNYEWSDALISYSYRTGLIQTDYSGAAAAQALASGAQLLLGPAAGGPVCADPSRAGRAPGSARRLPRPRCFLFC